MMWKRCFYFLLIVVSLCACSESGKTAGTDEQSEGVVAVKDREIAGVSQKGPFLVGSSVTIQELNDESFAQTGRSFRTSVKSNQGDFVLKGVNLVSPYALLEVNGYYRNEVTGKNSEGMVSLNALTDLTDRNHVNVNVLTHLETDRVLYLVRTLGMPFASAKEQAEHEILAQFGIDDVLTKTEDMDLFVGEGSALLLALSVMLQRDDSAAELSERLALATLSLAKNEGLGVEVADWAYQEESCYWHNCVYSDSVLYRVAQNMKSWIEGWDDSELTMYMYKYWEHAYGLSACDENRYNEIRENSNEQSRYFGKNFKCDERYKRWLCIGGCSYSW